MEKLTKNAAECVKCHMVLESTNRHDFQTHACDPSIWFFVDGGKEYTRRGWKADTQPSDNFIDRSEYQ